MSAPLQVYFMRHGETAWSLSGQHTGITDLPLTPQGQEMARRLATTLKGIAFSAVLTSPRLRAHSTCEGAGLGAAAQTDPNLAEWNYGDYEGLRTTEIHERRPHWNVWEDGCPGGESPEEVTARADKVIARLCEFGDEVGGNVALFSHGQFGRVLAARWIGLPVGEGQHFALAPASVSILGFDAHHRQRRVIALWNATASGSVRAA